MSDGGGRGFDSGFLDVDLDLRVEWRTSLSLLGTIVKYLAAALVPPLALGLYDGDWVGVLAFAVTALVAVLAGTALERLDPDPDLDPREALLTVALTWLAAASLGAVPFVLAGTGTISQPLNALFESMSGFTTTGATVMGSISLDTHSRAIMLWRQEIQWLGGMGIVVLAVAILPELAVGGTQLMDAEAPGPGIQKLTPRIAETARALWIAYIGFTVLEFVLLYGLHFVGSAPNMTLFNAISHPLTTMPTGGFSPEARSIEAFAPIVQWVIIPFMIVAGTNFALIWGATHGEGSVLGEGGLFGDEGVLGPEGAFRGDSEFRAYAGVLAVLSALATVLLFTDPGLTDVENVGRVTGALEPALRHGTFQVVSIVTTTGYASLDFTAWSEPARYLLLFVMFIGGSAGSTGGAVKIVRWVVIVKTLRRELFRTVHPEAIRPVRLGGRPVNERGIEGIFAFTLIYFVAFFVATGVVLVDTQVAGTPLGVFGAMSAIAATLGNVGPGFGVVGPMGSYLSLPPLSKLLMVGLMWLGRLEIIPVLVLLTGAYWRS
jgi:trk system potassium uptake protein TrkH